MNPVLDYHQNTKHSFHRFARSLGYLDWAAQPDPFRRYGGAARIPLPRTAYALDVPYPALFANGVPPAPLDQASVGEFLRCSMGLSAWKQHGSSRWALRVNPSSGNLHPTEAYVVWNGRVCHYAPREHELELRAELRPPRALNRQPAATADDEWLVVGLTSILWREAWKYGERAFRYCQHDVGHAIGALRFAAGLLGWRLTLLEQLADEQIATLLGLDRDADYADAEREEPECLLLVSTTTAPTVFDIEGLIAAAKDASWAGTANALSRSHVPWPAIDTVVEATRKPRTSPRSMTENPPAPPTPGTGDVTARQIILQRRSALGFDGASSLPADRFVSMLHRLQPGAPPWDAIDWRPQVHLVLFVHRVDGLHPGVYAYLRGVEATDDLRAAMNGDFLWEAVDDHLYLLVPADVRFAANRLSCDQDIAADGFFSLAMIARFQQSLRERGDWFYRRLFWETGLIGQVLYWVAEAARARATGIGCFYDDPVHATLGFSDTEWQSLYHFSMGVPVDDGRLTSEPGYPDGF